MTSRTVHVFGAKRVRYGRGRNQFGVLRLGRSDVPMPIVVFVHGGNWAMPYNRWVMWLVVRDARRRGWATFNVEYRKLGRCGGGGGWPHTFDDVRSAIETITDGAHDGADRIDPERIAVVGHSAGAHLALWTAGMRSAAQPAVIVSMAGPTDLEQISADGSPSVDELVAGSPENNRWQLTSPIEMLPLPTTVVCVHGDADTTVRSWNSERLVQENSAAGGTSSLVVVRREDHLDAVKPKSGMWAAAVEAIEAAFAG